jgi:hypothetical protein
MPKTYIPHTIEARDASASIYTIDPTKAQLNFWEGEKDVHYVLMSAPVLAKLEVEIRDALEKLSGGS